MKFVPDSVQAVSALVVASLTVWLVFFSDVGDLAVSLLQADLQQAIIDKTQLEEERERLKNDQDKIENEKEEHVKYVVSARLDDIWLHGTKKLETYGEISELGMDYVVTANMIEPYRNWKPDLNLEDISETWIRSLPSSEMDYDGERSERNDLNPIRFAPWKCSEEFEFELDSSVSSQIEQQMLEQNGTKGDIASIKGGNAQSVLTGVASVLERLYGKFEKLLEEVRNARSRQLAEYHVRCFVEYRSRFFEYVTTSGEESKLTVEYFVFELLQYLETLNTSEEVRRRIRVQLDGEISDDFGLATSVIQLQVQKENTLDEIESEAKNVQANIARLRDRLNEATIDRLDWSKEVNEGT